MESYSELRRKWETEGKLPEFEERMTNLQNVVMRQTDYSAEMARSKLEEHDLDVQKIVREYMGLDDKKAEADTRSTHQKVYSEFRSFLDDAAGSYYRKKEAEEKLTQLKEMQRARITKIIEARKNAEENNTVINDDVGPEVAGAEVAGAEVAGAEVEGKSDK